MFTRSQAATISILAGLVIVVFMGLVVIALLPGDIMFTPAVTPSPTIAPTATPTFPNFMPTASQVSPTPAEPTPTNTRIPTSIPLPTRTPRPTAIINLPTPVVRPTATRVAAPPPPPLPAASPGPTPTQLLQLQYSVSFDAESTSVDLGQCTDLIWQTQGVINLQLDRSPVEPVGRKKVCPETNTKYTLTFQVIDSAEIETRVVEILVIEESEDDPFQK